MALAPWLLLHRLERRRKASVEPLLQLLRPRLTSKQQLWPDIGQRRRKATEIRGKCPENAFVHPVSQAFYHKTSVLQPSEVPYRSSSMQLGAPLRVLDLDLGTEVRPRHLQTLALGACGRGGMVSITRGIVYVLLSICCWCKLIMHVLQHLRLVHWLCLAFFSLPFHCLATSLWRPSGCSIASSAGSWKLDSWASC